MIGKAIDLTGQRFGRLVPIARSSQPEGSRQHSSWWLCQCDCGKRKVVATTSLKDGSTASCGCLRSETAMQNVQKAIQARKKARSVQKADPPKPRREKKTRPVRILPKAKALAARTATVNMSMPVVSCCKCGKAFELLSPQWAYQDKKSGKKRYGCSWRCWNARDAK
jgi:hypothetical protein